MLAWIRHKWETAETWLPWFLGIASALVLIIGFVVGLLRDPKPGISSVHIEITDDEPPSEDGGSGGSKSGSRYKISTKTSSSPDSPSDRAPSSSNPLPSAVAQIVTQFVVQIQDPRPPEKIREEIQFRTGVSARRARAVVLIANKLRQPVGHEMRLNLSLFSDLSLPVKLNAVSDFEVNEGIRSGYVENDESSRVQLTTADGMVSGFITYRGVQYRIVADPARGIHYIIEVEGS